MTTPTPNQRPAPERILSKLSRRHNEVYHYIKVRIEVSKAIPSVKDVADAFEYKSKRSAARIIDSLIAHGLLERHSGGHRQIKLCHSHDAAMQPQPALAPDAQKARSAEVDTENLAVFITEKLVTKTSFTIPPEDVAQIIDDELKRWLPPQLEATQQGALLDKVIQVTKDFWAGQTVWYDQAELERRLAALSQPASPEPQEGK